MLTMGDVVSSQFSFLLAVFLLAMLIVLFFVCEVRVMLGEGWRMDEWGLRGERVSLVICIYVKE